MTTALFDATSRPTRAARAQRPAVRSATGRALVALSRVIRAIGNAFADRHLLVTPRGYLDGYARRD